MSVCKRFVICNPKIHQQMANNYKEKFMLTPVKNDLFNICKRLRFINRDYRMFFNGKAQRYEVHNQNGLCFVVPYGALDERTLDYAWRTRIENLDYLESQFEENNREIEQSVRDKAKQSAMMFGDMMKYASGQMHEVIFRGGQHRWY